MSDNENPAQKLRDQSSNALSRRLDELIDAIDATEAGPEADDKRALLLDLQAHQIELEMQGRELREAHQALEISRDRYARLFDLAPVGYAVMDRHSRIREINLAGARMLRRTRTALIDTPLSAYLAPGDMRALIAHVEIILRGEPSATPRELKVCLRGDGEPRTLELQSCRREGEDGPECFSALLDVTAREEAQRRQRESDRLRQAVLDAIPAEIVVLDRRGQIIAANQAWRHFAGGSGGSPELRDGLGMDYLAACRRIRGNGGEEVNAIAHGIASVLSGECPHFVQEYPFHTPGRQRWYALTAAPVNSEPAAAVLVHFDITERKLAEDRVRQARDTLAQATRVNAVGTLAVSLIHELTQPLSAAGFYSGTAVALLEQGTSTPEKLRSALAGLDGQIKRTADILQRLRDFARQRERHVTEVEIDQVVAQALALVGWFAVDRHVNLKYARPAPGLTVHGETVQLEQVLVSLVCNGVQAIDAADSPRREVSVGVEGRRGEIEVTVRDTGPGVPPEMQDRLFDIFATSKTSGLGMGLAISRDIVEAHEGQLWLESNPEEGQGAVFRFTLPCPGAEVQR